MIRKLDCVDREHLLLSSISEDVIKRSGVYSINCNEASKEFGFKINGIVFPYYDFDGTKIGERVRKRNPGKNSAKYLQRAGTKNELYFLKDQSEKLLGGGIEDCKLFLVEGEKKLLSFMSNYESKDEWTAASIPGCWGYLQRIENDQRALIDMLVECKPWSREICIIPDTDYFWNENVMIAYNLLVAMLANRGARVTVIDLRIDDSTRLGLDDFISIKGVAEFNRRVRKSKIIDVGLGLESEL